MKNAGYIHVPSFRFCYQSVLNFQLSNHCCPFKIFSSIASLWMTGNYGDL